MTGLSEEVAELRIGQLKREVDRLTREHGELVEALHPEASEWSHRRRVLWAKRDRRQAGPLVLERKVSMLNRRLDDETRGHILSKAREEERTRERDELRDRASAVLDFAEDALDSDAWSDYSALEGTISRLRAALPERP